MFSLIALRHISAVQSANRIKKLSPVCLSVLDPPFQWKEEQLQITDKERYRLDCSSNNKRKKYICLLEGKTKPSLELFLFSKYILF